MDRGEENFRIGHAGDVLEYTPEADTDVCEIRLIFDNDTNRDYHNMPCNYPLVQAKFKLPKTLLRAYRPEGIDDGGKKYAICVEPPDALSSIVSIGVSKRYASFRFPPMALPNSVFWL